MTHYRNKYFLLALASVLSLSACKKQWDQRTQVTDQNLNINLLQQIKANSNLSIFARYLKQTGEDAKLAGSKTYTVWVPTNAAIQAIDTSFATNPAQLKQFVDNHIANQSYLTSNVKALLKVHNLLGKNLTLTTTTVDDVSITSKDIFVSNGVLNIIGTPLTPRQNISEYIRSLTTDAAMIRDYVNSNDTTYVDTTLATVDHLDPVTGKPILVPGTGGITYNKYFKKTATLDVEDSTYTYFVLTDNALTSERNKVTKYFKTATGLGDTTIQLANFNVMKDLIVRGAVQSTDLPASLTSINGIPFLINNNKVLRSYKASNGMVYVMDLGGVTFNVADKIPTIIIQGENPSFFARTDQGSHVAYRPSIAYDGTRYTDLYISGVGLASYFAGYKLSHLNTCRYNVVWRAVNDTLVTKIPTAAKGNTNGDGVISQTITFGEINAFVISSLTMVPTTTVKFPYTKILPARYPDPNAYRKVPEYTPELQLTGATTTATANSTATASGGTLSVTKLRSLNMYVTGAAVTTSNLNNILIDYIKLIPIIE